MARKRKLAAHAVKKASATFDVDVRATFRVAFPKGMSGRVFCSVDELDGASEPASFKATAKGVERYFKYELEGVLGNLEEIAEVSVSRIKGQVSAKGGK